VAGAALVALVAGGAGLRAATPAGPGSRLPAPVAATARTVVGALAAVTAGSAGLVAAALVADLGTAREMVWGLGGGTAAAVLVTVVSGLLAPNAAWLGSAYLLGPGFAVGSGTVVSPAVVLLGPLPAFPLLAALPDDEPTAAWVITLTALPVLLSAVGATAALRRVATGRWEVDAAVGLAGGALAGLALAGLVVLSGGSAGPGRMADVGVRRRDRRADAVPG
jgi:hypothetical protein